MKLSRSNQRNHALTLVEVLAVVLAIGILLAIFLPALAASKQKHSRIGCINNLKQIGLSFRIWSGDNSDKYSMQLSETNGGTEELALRGDATAIFRGMSNEIGSSRVLCCPNDISRRAATNFTTDLPSKISYFVNVDAGETYSQMILSGDDNFEISGVPVPSGLLEISTNTPIAWTTARHNRAGNLGLGDGSVQQVTQSGLRSALLATNRLAIP